MMRFLNRQSLRVLKKLKIVVQRNYSTINESTLGETVQVGDYTIYYEKIGKGPQPVFLMPGALGTARTDFNEQLVKLDRDKWTLIAWDPPGYGYSRPPDRTFPLDFFKRDAHVAAQFLQEILKLKTANIIGWSDGGITALILAATYPNLVRRLVVFGANSYITDEDMKRYEAVRNIEAWSALMRKPMEDIYGFEYFQHTWSSWVDAMQAIYEKNNGNICKDMVSQVRCPTFVIHGAQDPMVPQFHADFLRKNIKNVRYLEMKYGKHNLHQRYSAEFNLEVEKFLIEM